MKVLRTTIQQKITTIQFEGEYLIIQPETETHKWRMKEISEKLSRASEAERNNFQISPSGYGIHWPLIDEDLSIHGLLHDLK